MKMEVNIEKLTIDDMVLLDSAFQKGARTSVRFGEVVAILNKAVTVEGYTSVGQLPITALQSIIEAIMTEMESMNKVETPTAASG